MGFEHKFPKHWDPEKKTRYLERDAPLPSWVQPERIEWVVSRPGAPGDGMGAEDYLHRLDGPAVQSEYLVGFEGRAGRDHEEWWAYGARHREDGPAVIERREVDRFDHDIPPMDDSHVVILEDEEWWLYGVQVTEAEHTALMALPERIRERIHGCVHDDGGTSRWYRNGVLHRDDGPAVESADPDVAWEWWVQGQRHRTDGPAIDHDALGEHRYEWWVEGERHRDNGPAIVVDHHTGPCAGQRDVAWWWKGEEVSEAEHDSITTGIDRRTLNANSVCPDCPAKRLLDRVATQPAAPPETTLQL